MRSVTSTRTRWSCLLTLALFWSPALGAPPASSPNVVLFCIDTLRADHVHCYGYPRPTSPTLDRLAADGTLFERAFAQAGWSLPSYSSLFTSRYSPSAKELGQTGGGPSRVLAGIFRTFGYRTAAFVGGGHLSPGFGLNGGFDTYRSSLVLGSFSQTVPQAVDWLDHRPVGRFFLLVHGYDVHGPYRPPMVFSELYDPGYRGVVHAPGFLQPKVLEGIRDNQYALSDLIGFEPETGIDWHEPERRRAVLPPFAPDLPPAPSSGIASPSVFAARTSVPPAPVGTAQAQALPFELPARRLPLSTADLEHLRAHYDGGVTYADAWLALFLEALSARGLDRDTLVVVLGDHGEDLGEHGRFAHGSALHDNLLHVPLIVRGPGVAAGRRVGQVVQLLDVAPTLLELCGIPAFHDHQGRSLARLAGGHDPLPGPSPAPAAFAFDESLSSLRTERWHLLRSDERKLGGPVVESLFDIGSDPHESKDVSTANPGAMTELRGRLLDQLEETILTSPRDASRLSMEEKRFMSLMGYW